MKKYLLLLVALVISADTFAGTYYFAWDGYGSAVKHNYGLTYGFGSYQYKPIVKGLGFGFQEINQKYDLYYDDERGSNTGASVRFKLNYYYISPMFVFQLNKTGQLQCYITGGVGFAQGADVQLHKWSHQPWTPAGGVYDSMIDMSKAVNSPIMRFACGFTQFYRLGGIFHLFINEDFGFTPSSMLKTSEFGEDQLRTNEAQLFRPLFISLRVGIALITRSRNNPEPYVIK